MLFLVAFSLYVVMLLPTTLIEGKIPIFSFQSIGNATKPHTLLQCTVVCLFFWLGTILPSDGLVTRNIGEVESLPFVDDKCFACDEYTEYPVNGLCFAYCVELDCVNMDHPLCQVLAVEFLELTGEEMPW